MRPSVFHLDHFFWLGLFHDTVKWGSVYWERNRSQESKNRDFGGTDKGVCIKVTQYMACQTHGGISPHILSPFLWSSEVFIFGWMCFILSFRTLKYEKKMFFLKLVIWMNFLLLDESLLKERKWLVIKSEDDTFTFITTCSLRKFDLPPTFVIFPTFAISDEHFKFTN